MTGYSSNGARETCRAKGTPAATRREFLKQAAALPAALAVSGIACGAAAPEASSLPQIRIGPHSLSRLICGANPFHAGSHLSWFVNQEMKRYYTTEQILKTLRRCEEVGINCWQSGGGAFDVYRQFVDAGGKMHFLSLEAGKTSVSYLPKLAKGGCIGVAHHGEVTDQLFKQGKIDQVRDYLKRIHDAGLPAGISTHMPAVVDAVESKGWEVDYYMTCVYERHRSREDFQKLLGHVPIPVGEVYLESDPPRMYQAMRNTKRPCLAFKILAAGRLSEHPGWVEGAFRQTLESTKPTDGIIIGIYDKFSDQPAEDAAFVRRYASRSRAV
jgi:hypothetical protein